MDNYRKIGFNVPYISGKEIEYMSQAIEGKKISGEDGFNFKCNQWFENKFKAVKSVITTSCTHSLELSALLLDIKSGDEVIMPSYTYVSTANAFALRGAMCIFVDINPRTMNIDENRLEAAITDKTKAIVVVHYAGIACNMDKILDISKKYNLSIVEDAAQGFLATYKESYLGTIGDIGCFSFHDTKNITMGQGGAIIINNKKYEERLMILRDKGTNKKDFMQGLVDKYTWVDVGSSYVPSEISAAFLYAQLEKVDIVNQKRRLLWDEYYNLLIMLENTGLITLPYIPQHCNHNSHIFYIKLKDKLVRDELINYLKGFNISAFFHFIPLHTSNAGKIFGEFRGVDEFTTIESEKLLRLPMHFYLSIEDVSYVVDKIYDFFKQNK